MKVLGIGFNCVDIIRTNQIETITAGGTCTNVLAMLSSWGIETSLLLPNYCKDDAFEFFLNDITKKNVKYILYKKTNKPFSVIIQENFCEDHRFLTSCPKCGNPTINSISFNEIDAQKNIDVLKKSNILFCDRFSQGIKYLSEICHKKNILTFYEPNNCRFYNTQLEAIKNFDIVKFSNSRIGEKTSEKLKKDLSNSRIKLIIVTLGNEGLKFSIRQGDRLSDWIEIKSSFGNDAVDSSGAGDCLTAAIIYSILYNQNYNKKDFSAHWLHEILNKAQMISSINCGCVGAQGILYDAKSFEMSCNILNACIPSTNHKHTTKPYKFHCSNCNNLL